MTRTIVAAIFVRYILPFYSKTDCSPVEAEEKKRLDVRTIFEFFN